MYKNLALALVIIIIIYHDLFDDLFVQHNFSPNLKLKSYKSETQLLAVTVGQQPLL